MSAFLTSRRALLGLGAGVASITISVMAYALSPPVAPPSLKQKVLNAQLVVIGEIEGEFFREHHASSPEYLRDFSENNQQRSRNAYYNVRPVEILWNRSELRLRPVVTISRHLYVSAQPLASKTRRIFFVNSVTDVNTPDGLRRTYETAEDGMSLDLEEEIRKYIFEINHGNRL